MGRLVFMGRLISAARAHIATRCLLYALVLMMFASACAHHSTARLPAPPAAPARIGSTETGFASWYGVPYHGRRAASGEIFDMEKLTAAHPALPFQTWVEVTNLSNGKQVDVRINDRGPFVRGRIIDVSMAAARQLDMVRAGTARVRLKVILPPVNALENPPKVASGYAVQAGAFSDPSRAEAFRAALPYSDTRVVERPGNPSVWRVLVGHALTIQAATALSSGVEKAVGQAVVIKEEAVRE
jgi:rare lipoprotein A